MQSLDLILFGGAALFVGAIFLLTSGGRDDRKVSKRIRQVSRDGIPQQVQNQAMSLSRKQDHSFGSFGERLQGRLRMAGLEVSSAQYLIWCGAIGVMVMLPLLLKSLPLALMAGFAAGAGLPHFYLGFRIGRKKKKFLRLFPDAIELIVRGLRAGLPVAESMRNIAQEIPEPVGPVFEELCDQLALGITLDKAMDEMARRLGMTEFNFFVISVILQRETGGNLGEILSNLADVLRQRHIMKLKIKALSSEARASAVIVGLLPVFVISALAVTSPDYLRPMVEDSRGNMAALVAVCSLAFGVFIMARMAQFKI